MVVSCERYEEIWEKLRDHEQRIEQLEKQCRELNSNVKALQTILAAVQQNDYVTDVMKVMENGVEVGYSITFAKSGTITIYHGADGAAGTTGATPQISVRKAEDGSYYWTSNGEWITDENGDKIPAAYSDGGDGKYITPQFRIVDDVWYVSYDNGNSWREIESGNDEEDPLFKSVSYDGSYVYITLADGTPITIPVKDVVDGQQNITSEVRLAKRYDLVVGDNFQLFYTGVVKTFNIANEGIRVVCKVGKQMPRYFEYTPTEEDAGKSYKLTITTRRFDGSVISVGETMLYVHPKLTEWTTPFNVNVLIFGDSLTSSGTWAGEGLRRIYGTDMSVMPQSLGVANTCTTYGTKVATINGYKVYHEGYGGWTWGSFLAMNATNPFYNAETGLVDFKYHAEKYGSPGPDVVAILLTWNSGGGVADFNHESKIAAHMNNATSILRKIHSDYPNAKIICMGIQINSLNGGTGSSYGATGGYSDPYATAFYAFDYNKALEDLVTNDEFGQYCFYVDTKGQFDVEYNMPNSEKDVNDRNDAYSEIVGTNGVHPSTKGYYQIGDAFYRALHRVLPSAESNSPILSNTTIKMALYAGPSVSVSLTGRLDTHKENLPNSEVYLYYCEGDTFDESVAECVSTSTFDDRRYFAIQIPGLKADTDYSYYFKIVVNGEEYTCKEKIFTTLSGEPFLKGYYDFTYAKWQIYKHIRDTDGIVAGGTETYTACEDYIPVVAGGTYNMTLDGSVKQMRWYAWYDFNKEYISGCKTNTTDLVAPDNACYLRITLSADRGWYVAGTQTVDENGYLTNPDPSKIRLVLKD